MENVSKINTKLVLLGVVEMESLWYLYATSAIIMYFAVMILTSLIVYTVWSAETLHEPMYIFIGNLVVNIMYGISSILPKMVIDLLFGFSTISLPGCLMQAFCVQSYACLEMFSFTIMAYDRYLAVSHPLRYRTMMTNERAFQILLVLLVYIFLSIGVFVVLAARLSICGMYINNIYCETFSLLHLACGDITIHSIFGTIWTLSMMVGCILMVIYCYIRTFLVCLKISAEAYQKAMHTLVTHIVTFSTYMATSLFVALRYRWGNGSLSTVGHVVISITSLIVPVTLNPLIYGIRIEALRIKIIANLQKNGFMSESCNNKTFLTLHKQRSINCK